MEQCKLNKDIHELVFNKLTVKDTTREQKGHFKRLRHFLRIENEHTWRKGLLELVSFLSIKDTKRVEILLTSHFEFHHIFASLNLDGPRIFSPRSEEEVLDLVDLLRLHW